jgi:hypothetical protein
MAESNGIEPDHRRKRAKLGVLGVLCGSSDLLFALWRQSCVIAIGPSQINAAG